MCGAGRDSGLVRQVAKEEKQRRRSVYIDQYSKKRNIMFSLDNVHRANDVHTKAQRVPIIVLECTTCAHYAAWRAHLYPSHYNLPARPLLPNTKQSSQLLRPATVTPCIIIIVTKIVKGKTKTNPA